MKQELFNYLSEEHNLTLLDNELEEIIRIVNSSKEVFNSALHKTNVMPRFLFRYKCLDENFKVEIEAENLNKAMFNFATYYHQIQEIYSVVRVP